MRIWILICVAGLAASGCLLRHNNKEKETTQYSAVPGLVSEPTNGPTITIVSNTPPPEVSTTTPTPTPVPEPKPVPTVAASTTTATTAPPTNPPTAPVTTLTVENTNPVPVPAITTTATPVHPAVTETNAVHPIVTPTQGLTGKVASVNGAGKFVVLSFPLGQMPAFDQTLTLYRRGVKVAEVKVTGPKLDENIVADLAQGGAEVGDDVRDH